MIYKLLVYANYTLPLNANQPCYYKTVWFSFYIHRGVEIPPLLQGVEIPPLLQGVEIPPLLQVEGKCPRTFSNTQLLK